MRNYPSLATEAAFELGGIGTGNVSLGARGEFRDWELSNRAGVGVSLPYSFFALRFEGADTGTGSKVLEARHVAPYRGGDGFRYGGMAGLPRFAESTLSCKYPFATIAFEDPSVPLRIELEAFTPFVPLDAAKSGLPVASLRYRVQNLTDEPLDISVAGSLGSPIGIGGFDRFDMPVYHGQPKNSRVATGELEGVLFETDLPADDFDYGTVVLATTLGQDSTATPEWIAGYWQDGPETFWNDFTSDGRLEAVQSADKIGASRLAANDLEGASLKPGLRVGSVAVSKTVMPGATADFEFVLAWHFPNRPRAWLGNVFHDEPHRNEVVRNYYAAQFGDAVAVADHFVCHSASLEASSRAFADALYGSTFNDDVVEALVSGIAALRSTTCFRLESGTFLGWEGSFDHDGSCEGTCTHVWNYAQTVAFLFPELEVSAREVEFLLETDDDGAMAFRTRQVFGAPKWDMIPAADGQLGCIVRLYREWRNTGDDDLVRRCWPAVEAILRYAARNWDQDGDGVLEGEQHTTYDIEFHGKNSVVGAIYVTALLAAAALANAVGLHAHEYEETARRSAARLDEETFNGSFYVQALDDPDEFAYQYASGVQSDQLFGQFLANVVGLGPILPPDHVEKALLAILEHNFRSSLDQVATVQRTYALNDEPGLVLCSWPFGGRPRLPFVYSDEVWTGVEYHVAASLIWAGHVPEGLALVAAVRSRYDGYRRSPWNEVECGYHYARSMSGWGLLLALGGFDYTAKTGDLSLNPALDGPMDSLFTAGGAWGVWRLTGDHVEFSVLGGELTLGEVRVSGRSAHRSDGKAGPDRVHAGQAVRYELA